MDSALRELLERMLSNQNETLRIVRDHARETDNLARVTLRLVNAVEQDDHLRERLEKAEEKERDARYEEVDAALRTIDHGITTLPDACIAAVEKKIYELRLARHEALTAGVSNAPPPLMPPSLRREPTGSFALALTPEQQHGLIAGGLRIWHWTKWPTFWIGLTTALHQAWAWLAHR